VVLQMIVVLSLALALAVLLFAVILQFIREDRAHEQQLAESVQTNRLLKKLSVQLRSWVPGEPHQSMPLPAYTAPAADPMAVHDPTLRRVVEVTRDEPPSSEPSIEMTGEEPLPRDVAPLSAGRAQGRLEGPTLPSYQMLPALGEDEDDGDTRAMTRVGPPPVRGQ
jgi:hypothetical protein